MKEKKFTLSKQDCKTAILIDPDKEDRNSLDRKIGLIGESSFDIVLVGGSIVSPDKMDYICGMLHNKVPQPLIIFPGGAHQVTKHCDGILLLSLISGDNPQFLIQEQIKAVPVLEELNIPIYSTGYMLIDGGTKSSVSKVSKTTPLNQGDVEHIRRTAVAGNMLGLSIIYLDAGSGAKQKVNAKIIRTVSNSVSTPVVIGGGIKSETEINEAFNNGANLVVIGNHLERHPELMKELKGREGAYHQSQSQPSSNKTVAFGK